MKRCKPIISNTVVSLNDTTIHKLRDIKPGLLLLQLYVSGILQNAGLNLNAFTGKERGKGAGKRYTFRILQHPVWSERWPHQISASLLTPIFNALSILSDAEHWSSGYFCVLNRTYFAWGVFGGRLYISTDLQKAV